MKVLLVPRFDSVAINKKITELYLCFGGYCEDTLRLFVLSDS